VPDAAAILPPQLTDNEAFKTALDQGTKVLASTQVQYVYHEAQDHPMALVVAAAALVAGYALWASRRTILWKLAQQQGYPEDVETVINKYCVETTPMKKGRSSAKFGVVSPLWNRNEQLAMKVSSGLQSWQQERDMFQKLRGGGGPFVQLYDAVPNYNGRGANMLIQECGDQDLLDCINERGPLPIRDTRKYGRQALRSVQALHRKGLVWCDCKPENFILVNGKLKAIDLETVVPVGADIPGFTPEVAPPELAIWERPPRRTAALAAQKSYDMWSLGMVLLHMHLGRSYWDGTTNSTIISSMRAQGFEVDLSEVRDPVLASLLKGLLQTDPKRRFNATIAAAHPFWLLP
jgi:serine/threonine protein kinase